VRGEVKLMRQVVDYRAYDPLQDYLAERFKERQFDAILDCVGTQALYAHSPRYLKAGGKFVNIVGGWSQGVVPFVRNKLRPCLLGGVPRSYELFLLSASGKTARDVAAWVEQGVVKKAVVDSEFPFEQAAEVRTVMTAVRHELTFVRHSKGWQPAGPGARLLSKSEGS
jgi:NADPH:quinone reductase-like Zn-dependent oxidoreductase